jgi:hypothetical protein
MRVRRTSLRKPSTPNAGRAYACEEPILDTWLTRASSLSQPLLLCLAVFGYFYTVLPVYQKELLSEQIAAKEIELTRLQRAIDATGPTIQRLEGERTALGTQLRSLQALKTAAERNVAELNARQSTLEAKNKELDASRTKLTEEVATVEAAAKAFSMRTYHDSFANSVLVRHSLGAPNPYEIVESPTYEAIAGFLLTPYAAISSTLALGDSKFIESAASVPRQVKDEYHARVRAALELRKEALAKPHDDINAMLIQIKESLTRAAVDPTPADRFNERLFETKARLAKVLYDSRQREWDRTKKFLEAVAPSESK